MNKGGRLIISTENAYIDKPSGTFEVISEGKYVTAKISDTGDGIAKKDLDRIFEIFLHQKNHG